jgi:NAD(P)-dependent dehydrogenase (short-subunit alcohol dehydrogenase family)
MNWTLVTGGAKRLGAEICLCLADKGYNLVIHYNHSQTEALDIAEKCRKKGVQAETIQGDFSTVDSTLLFVNTYQNQFPNTLNLINNVGNYLLKPASTTTHAEWSQIIHNNLTAPFILIQALIENLKHSKGSIVNLGIAGLTNLRADKYSTCYSCAKTSLWVLTKSLALELAPFHVRVNMVSPGYLDFSKDLPPDISKLPMQRTASGKEVAEVIAFLLSPTNSYITGQNIEVAGGIRL